LDFLSPTNAIPNPLTIEEEVLCGKQNDLADFDVGEYLVAFDVEAGTQDVGLVVQHVQEEYVLIATIPNTRT
jgi:hypothetical protein